MVSKTVVAEGWFVDSPSPLSSLYSVATLGAREHSLAHHGDEVVGSGDHSGNGDELVDVLGTDVAHVLGLVCGVASDLDLVKKGNLSKNILLAAMSRVWISSWG